MKLKQRDELLVLALKQLRELNNIDKRWEVHSVAESLVTEYKDMDYKLSKKSILQYQYD